MNLSHFKYRNILSSDGGPIDKILLPKIKNKDGYFEALAFLRPALTSYAPHNLYGNADGTGSSIYRHVAIHKAISEAIERWAYFSSKNNTDFKKFRFDVDPTTTGMAAFPGQFKSWSRNIAIAEAIERWSVGAWWEGVLGSQTIDNLPYAIELITPWSQSYKTVISWQSSSLGIYSYGFATHPQLKGALEKANIERGRNEIVLTKHCAKGINGKTEFGSDLEIVGERRALYFSQRDGYERFLERVKSSKEIKSASLPKKLIDAEIRGSWSSYAVVWRCLFEPTSLRFLNADDDYFLF